jgi:RHS repeat-associated protein
VGAKNPYRYRGYRYDSETGLYYLQSRYYNPEWGRFVNADGLVGQRGELLAHNLFAYCKNNPVTMKDSNGFLAKYSSDEAEETQYETVRTVAAVANRNKNIKYDYVGAATGPSVSTSIAIATEKTVGKTIVKSGFYSGFQIPVKLSTLESASRFSNCFVAVSLTFSVKDNFSGKYCNNEAWARTAIDVASTVAIIAFCAGGGWAPIAAGFAIAGVAEVFKFGIDKWFKRNE